MNEKRKIFHDRESTSKKLKYDDEIEQYPLSLDFF